MSLSQYNLSSQLSTNAKAQGRKLTLKVVRNLDTDRSDWMSDVVIKSSLLGPHGTLRVRWIPVDLGYQLKVTGDIKKQINPSSTLKGKTTWVNCRIYMQYSVNTHTQASSTITNKTLYLAVADTPEDVRLFNSMRSVYSR